MMNRTEWINARKKGIGGSDAETGEVIEDDK